MKRLIYYISGIIFTNAIFLCCSYASNVDNRFDVDPTKFNLGQVRSIVYHQFIGEEDRDNPHPTTNVFYFYTTDLDKALRIFLLDEVALRKDLKEKYSGKISLRVLDEYMSKQALRTLTLFLHSKDSGANGRFYKIVSAKSKKGEGLGIAHYEYSDNKLFPVEMSKGDLSVIEKFSQDNTSIHIGQLGDTVKPMYYDGFKQGGDLVFEEIGGVKWRVKDKISHKVSHYIFDSSYLLKNYDDDYFKNHEIYIIKGLDLICLKRPVYRKDVFRYKEAIEITVPEIDFYWNWKIPSEDFCPKHGHACMRECSKK